MSDDELKKIAGVVKEVVSEEIKPVSEQVSSLNEQVVGINEQVADLTEKVEGVIIPTLEKHTEYFKKMVASLEKSDDNIERLDKRLLETEGRLGIQPPPEAHIIK